jgi:hypothetical protein
MPKPDRSTRYHLSDRVSANTNEYAAYSRRLLLANAAIAKHVEIIVT